ncbi:MAG: TonB-dependent receptor, partial [Chitinivibrionales bacterium]|nr:TonB-dependent receptor [Chitinivibrionales bacterium]
YNDMQDLILPYIDVNSLEVDSAGHFVVPVTFRNLAAAWSKGIEFEGAWSPVEWIIPFFNITFQKSEDMHYNVPLDYVPSVKASFGFDLSKTFGNYSLDIHFDEGVVGKRSYLNWQTPSIKDVRIIYDGPEPEVIPPERELDEYFRTDVKVRCEYKARMWGEFSALNLFNAEFEEAGGTIAPARLVYLGIGFRI